MDQTLPGLPPQHPLFLALNFSLIEQRETLAAIWQLTHELTALGRIAEPQVATVKVPWWREELDRWEQNEARHPATRRLHHLAQREPVVSAVRQLFLANLKQLTSPRYGDESEFWQRCENHGMGLGVVAAYLGPERPAVVSGYAAASSGIFAIECLLNAAADARADRILLPLDTIAAAGLDTQKLAAPSPETGFVKIRQSLAADARQRLREGVREIRTVPSLSEHRYVLVLASLYDACADALGSPRATVTWPAPLRQLWTAWQTARLAR